MEGALSGGYIDRLVLRDFKSYRGEQVVGPFSRFTCIIGPNGSGKSNVMDSIGFALGLDARDLRAQTLKQLIYGFQTGTEDGGDETHMDLTEDSEPSRGRRRQQQTSDSPFPKSATVTLYFVEGRGEGRDEAMVDDDDSGSELTTVEFSRTVHRRDSRCTFRLDGSRVTRQDYVTKLESYGVLVQARNFLVFQGDVESIASRTPKERSELFEQVSGSVSFAREYDRCKSAYERCSEIAIAAAERLKGDVAVHTRFKKEGKEARRFRRLQDLLESKLIEESLWKLYHIEWELKKERDFQKAKHTEIEGVVVQVNETHQSILEKRSVRAKTKRAILQFEKKLERQKVHLGTAQTEREECKAQIDHQEKLIRRKQRQLKKQKKERRAVKRSIRRYTRQLEELATERSEYERGIEEKLSQAGLEDLSQSDLLEYRRLKATADSRTLHLRQEYDVLQIRLENVERQLKACSEKKTQFEGVLTGHTTARGRIEAEIAGLVEVEERDTSELGVLRRELETTTSERDEGNRERERLEGDVRTIRDRLRDAQVEREASDREARVSQAIESMKSLFTTVYGRISDLYTVPQTNRYEVAVNVALGIHHDAVVTDTTETAMECVQYLKEQRVRPMMFLPLDKLRPKRIHERFRDLIGEDCRLVADVVAVQDDRFKKAVNYVFGNAVIAPDLEIARRLAYANSSGRCHFKVVTQDGTIIHKSGLLTGGNAHGLRQRARQSRESVTAAETARIEKEMDEKLTQLHRLSSSVRAKTKKMEELNERIEAIEGTLEFVQRDIRLRSRRVNEANQQVTSVEKQIASEDRKLTRLDAELTEKRGEMESKMSAINDLRRTVFATFAQRVDMPQIEQVEDLREDLERSRLKRLEEFDAQESKFSSAKDFETNRMKRLTGGSLAEAIETSTADLEDLKRKLTSGVENIESLEQRVSTGGVKMQELRDLLTDAEAALKAAEKVHESFQRTKAKLNKERLLLENRAEQLCGQRNDLVARCRMELIHLPFLDDTAHIRARKRRKRPAAAAAAGGGEDGEQPHEPGDSDEGDDDDDDDDDADIIESLSFSEAFVDPSGSHRAEENLVSGSPSSSSRKRKRSHEPSRLRLDFRDLRPETLNKTGVDYERVEQGFVEDIAATRSELEALAPSVGHEDRQIQAQKKREESETAVNQAREKANEAREAFEGVKKRRYDAFMEAFRPVQECIDHIYKKLTESETFPVGGTAHLALEDPNEPYLQGVSYNTIPPTKRYRKMELLSGGEKTLAALALLFAIRTVRPSPFFVLDEIDASLDSVNVNKVASYIRECSMECQFVVISLKDSFYACAETLVGVFSEPSLRSSRLLTWDLRKFD